MRSAIACTSAVAPVEVSECTTTAATSASSPVIAETTWSTSGRVAELEAQRHDLGAVGLGHLDPALAEVAGDTHSTRSPGESRLAKADSNAPVPEALNIRTSLAVRYTAFSFSMTPP